MKSILILLLLVFKAVENQSEVVDVHGYQEYNAESSDIKSPGDVFVWAESFENNLVQSEKTIFITHLLKSLSHSVQSCRKGMAKITLKFQNFFEDNDEIFEKVKVSQLIPLIGEKLKHDAMNGEIFEDFEDIPEEDLELIYDISLKSDSDNVPKYLQSLDILLKNLEHACHSLPLALPSSRDKGNPEEDVHRIAKRMTKWIERWATTIENRIDLFIKSCLDSNSCKENLKSIIESAMILLKEHPDILNEESVVKLKSQGQGREPVAMENLTPLEKVALAFGTPLNFQDEEEKAFEMTGKRLSPSLEKLISRSEDSWKASDKIDSIEESFLKVSNDRVAPPKAGEVEILRNFVAAEVPETFLSVAFGSNLIKDNGGKIPQNYNKFKNLASMLSPSVLRVGGSGANFLTYDPDIGSAPSKLELHHPKLNHMSEYELLKIRNGRIEEENKILQNLIPVSHGHPKQKRRQYQISLHTNDIKHFENSELCVPQIGLAEFSNFTMTGKQWEYLVTLVKDLDWTLLFDLNQFNRDSDGNWDSGNARKIFQDPNTKKIPIIWQVGNEPNNYAHKFDWSITPEQAAKDFSKLREELKAAGLTNVIIGPDVTRPRNLEEIDDNVGMDSMDFLRDFLKHGSNSIDAVAWHQYYVDGRTATVEDFTSEEMLNVFPKQLRAVTQLMKSQNIEKPIWITETASAWGGGAPELSNRFADIFLWLDKLGAAAFGGASIVMRQTLYGGCYGLLDHDLNPLPSYWASVLHKQIIGTKALVPAVRLAPKNIRIYSHCMKETHQNYKKGAIVIFGMNTGDQSEEMTIFGDQVRDSYIIQFELTPYQQDLQSRYVMLNGDKLQLNQDGTVPLLEGKHVAAGSLKFPPFSAQFYIIPDAGFENC